MAQRRVQLLLGAALVAAASPALADDLRGALTGAYETNPTLQAARASQRAVDEGVNIASAAGLPSLSGTVSYTEFLKKSANSFTAPDRALTTQASLSIPVFSGGAVKNAVRGAETRVGAGQADLRSTESSVFSQVVAAYLDVISNEAIVGLGRNNVAVLQTNLQSTRDRFEIGDLTRTDVAQSQSRLAVAQANNRTQQANLAAAREKYIQLVGKPPVDLAAPPPLPGMPASGEGASEAALNNNPDLIAARARSKAAGFDADAAGAGRLPKVSLFSSVDYTDYMGTLGAGTVPAGTLSQRTTTAQAGVRATIPIFSGGLPAAQQRQARARQDAALDQEIGIERQVIAGVRSAYSQWQAANEVIGSSQQAVDAAALSLEGVRAENTVGNRTILDILNAEQELLSAQVNLVNARRNAYVTGFNLIAAMGKAGARDLGLDGGALYDPVTNYNRVHGKLFDWDLDPVPSPQATRTVDTKVQDGSIQPKK